MDESNDPGVREMSPEECRDVFDGAARRYLKMSGEEFLAKWDDGTFKGRPDLWHAVDAVSILLPLVREITHESVL